MQFHSSPIDEHEEAPLADDGKWEDIVAAWRRRRERSKPRDGKNHCYVVSVSTGEGDSDAQFGEIRSLVGAQGDLVAGAEVLRLLKPDPRTFLGRGAYESIAAKADDCAADLLVIDAALSPSQARNLEDATGFPVADREAVILNVFLRHARTRKARIQVEIAQLEYLRPRIRGLGLAMDQQAGGVMRARGPGETASELMARRLDGRLAELRKAFAKLKRNGVVQRNGRASCERIALVGYTNAGKTTLMNGLADASLSAKDMPFETLDTTSRCLTRHGGDILLSDTVGFIRRLPPRLLASFESTLAEIREASLLAVVVDASDPEWELHVSTTDTVLAKLGAAKTPRYYVFNKTDRWTVPVPEERLRLACGGSSFSCLSGRDPEAVTRLKQALVAKVRQGRRPVRLFVPYTATRAMSTVHAHCVVTLAETRERGLRFTLEASARIVERIKREIEEDAS